MHFGKVRLVIFATLVVSCCVLVGLAPRRDLESRRGRVLSNREMAAVHGDIIANLMCSQDAFCTCTRKGFNDGKAVCRRCDDEDGNGKRTDWDICCVSTGPEMDECNEVGGASCKDLFVYEATSFEDKLACCNPCAGDSYVATDTKCTNRQDGVGDECNLRRENEGMKQVIAKHLSPNVFGSLVGDASLSEGVVIVCPPLKGWPLLVRARSLTRREFLPPLQLCMTMGRPHGTGEPLGSLSQ